MHQFWDASPPHCERGSANVVDAPVEVTVACCLCVRPESQSLPLQSLLQILGQGRRITGAKLTELIWFSNPQCVLQTCAVC